MMYPAPRQSNRGRDALHTPRRRRRAFTLVEMMVSLAVLSLALGIVGVVFAVTTRTANQAAAYSQALNWTRQFTLQIEEDLAQIDPSQSILIMVGRTQEAALTQDDLDARLHYRVLTGDPDNKDPDDEFADTPLTGYSDPRADLLAFLTNRAAASVAPPLDSPDSPFANGAKIAPQFVVYGHAALGDASWTGSEYVMPDVGDLAHIEQTVSGGDGQSVIPASEWHIARRATLIATEPDTRVIDFEDNDDMDRLIGCMPTDVLPGDGVLDFDLVYLLDRFNGWDAGSPSVRPALWRPYEFGDFSGALQGVIERLLYPDGSATNHHVATVLREVPFDLHENMGVQLLPGCAWFEVEFLMPEDPRNSLDYTPNPSIVNGGSRSDLLRWTSIEPGATYVFVPDSQENRSAIVDAYYDGGGNRLGDDFARIDSSIPDTAGNPVGNRRIRTWPYAVRVTVRVFDPQGRLAEPIVRSVVHRFE